MLNRLVLVAALFLLTVSIAYYVIPGFRYEALPVLVRLDIGWLALALGAILLHYLSEGARWWFYLRDRYATRERLLLSLLTVFSLTAFVTYLLPVKLGVPLRIYLLTSQLRLPLASASTLLLFDGLLSYGLWAAVTLALYPWFPRPSLPGELPLYLAIGLVVALAAFAIARRSIAAARRWREQLATLTPVALTGAVTVLALDIVGYIVRHGAILAALGTELAPVPLAFATVASITAGFLSMLPMGLGAYDVTLIFLLTLFGVPAEIAVLVPLINRAGNILVSVLLGIPASYHTGLSLVTLRRRCKVPRLS